MKRTQITCASRCKSRPSSGEIMINGKPVTHHCATIRANINSDPGNGLNNICSMDPSLKSERNKLCNDNKIDNKAAIQITPGPILLSTVGSGLMAKGNKLTTTTKKITGNMISARCLKAMRRSRNKHGNERITGVH